MNWQGGITESYLCQALFPAVIRPVLTAQGAGMQQRQTKKEGTMMRKRIMRACYAASAAAVMATSLSLGTASAATHAPRDTPACSFQCISFFSAQLGSNTDLNAYVPGDTGVGGMVGQKVNLHLAGNFRPNGDWEFAFQGQVFQFCGLLANDFFSPTSYVCLHFPFNPVMELDWAPFGNQSGLCAGVAKGGVAGENVTLQDCGMSANTVWIGDFAHGKNAPGFFGCFMQSPNPTPPGGAGAHLCPWINGGDTAFSHPLVMDLNTGTTKPTNQLMLEPENLVGASARSNQLFGFFIDPFGGI